MTFPSIEEAYAGFFALGFEKAGGETRRAGIAVVKRSYTIAGDQLQPDTANPLPIFAVNVPDNLVILSDFANNIPPGSEPPIYPDDYKPWVKTDNVTIATVNDSAAREHVLSVRRDAAGTATVMQPIDFEEPLGARRFQLSFWAKGAVGGEQVSAYLEADTDNGVERICERSVPLNSGWQRYTTGGLSSSATTWTTDLPATTLRVVFEAGSSTGDTVFYDQIQVEERAIVTVWNSGTTVLYESDLIPTKPHIDVIVLGNTATGINDTTWQVSLKPYWGAGNPEPAWTTSMVHLERSIPSGSRQKAMFGWHPSAADERRLQGGTFTNNADHLPPVWEPPDVPPANTARDPLPGDFDNGFYNGQLREPTIPAGDDLNTIDTAELITPPLTPLSKIRITVIRNAPHDDEHREFQLAADSLSAEYAVYSGTGEDTPDHWQVSSLTMTLDTLVVEPDDDRCYAVWRGAWNYDDYPEDAYRRLAVWVD
jgi:hypothetical protein